MEKQKYSKQLKLTDLLKSKNENGNRISQNIDSVDAGILKEKQVSLISSSSSIDTISASDVQKETNIADSEINYAMPPTDSSPINSMDRMVSSKSLQDFEFPKSQMNNDMKRRSFQLNWLDKFEWLEYSIDRNAAFCFPCRLFDVSGQKESTFTEKGYTDWKKALSKETGFYKHEVSLTHKKAMASWVEKRKRNEKCQTVTELLSSSILEKRTTYMRAIIEVIFFLVENELGFRGNWDSDLHKEDGIFRNLFEFKLKDNEELRNCQKIMPKNATYTSPEIQNELISIITKLTRRHAVSLVNTSDVDLFTLLSDGTKDRKNKECVSIAARYVRHGKPLESLLSLQATEKLDAKTNAELILTTLEECGVKTKAMLSQCYDGANVMKGDYGGIQRTIQEKLGRVIPYIHCFNHRLHLVIISAIEDVEMARLFFDNIKLVYTFFHRSKIQALYKGSAILNVIEIRWAGHVRAINVIFNCKYIAKGKS